MSPILAYSMYVPNHMIGYNYVWLLSLVSVISNVINGSDVLIGRSDPYHCKWSLFESSTNDLNKTLWKYFETMVFNIFTDKHNYNTATNFSHFFAIITSYQGHGHSTWSVTPSFVIAIMIIIIKHVHIYKTPVVFSFVQHKFNIVLILMLTWFLLICLLSYDVSSQKWECPPQRPPLTNLI